MPRPVTRLHPKTARTNTSCPEPNGAAGAAPSVEVSAAAPWTRAASLRSDPPLSARLDALVEKAVAGLALQPPQPDGTLGAFAGLASLLRSICTNEGSLIEVAIAEVARGNPDLVVVPGGRRLPVTETALEALATNREGDLEGLAFDAGGRSRGTYTPDLVVVHRQERTAALLDVKRSVASYLGSHRLENLRTRMLAVSLILPDWLYRTQKRLAVDAVRVAIVDAADGGADAGDGVVGLSDLDGVIWTPGAAATVARVREVFGHRVRALLGAEALKAIREQSICLAAARREDTRSDPDDGDPRPDDVPVGNDFQPAPPRSVRIGLARRSRT